MQGRIVISHNKQFFVTHFGPNGRKLNATETFTQKPSAWTNIKSQTRDFGKGAQIVVQDNSLVDGPALYMVYGTGKVVADPKGVTIKVIPGLDKLKIKDRKHPLKGKSISKKKGASKKAAPKKRKVVSRSNW
jgi:hypothetical protein